MERNLVDHGGTGYRLTPQGAELARRLGDLKLFAGRWGNQQRLRSNGHATRAASARQPVRASP